jgi:hypothetical protein
VNSEEESRECQSDKAHYQNTMKLDQEELSHIRTNSYIRQALPTKTLDEIKEQIERRSAEWIAGSDLNGLAFSCSDFWATAT